MVSMQKLLLCLAALIACVGSALIAIYLSSGNSDGRLLTGAALAAGLSTIFVLAGIIVSFRKPAGRTIHAVQPTQGAIPRAAQRVGTTSRGDNIGEMTTKTNNSPKTLRGSEERQDYS